MSHPRPDSQILAHGVAWIAGFRWTAQVLTWASTLLVVRLLAPGDYGIAALALTVVAVMAVLSEFGLGTAVLAAPELLPRQVAELNGAALLLAAFAGGVVALGAPLTARFYGQPELAVVLPVLSLAFLAEGVRVVPVAMLARALRYRETSLIDFTRAVCTAGIVLLLAMRGHGYWALVLGNLGGSLISAALVLSRHRQPLRRPSMAGLGSLLRLAREIVVARAAWILYRSADVFVAGRLFGAGPLGYYSMAVNLAALPGDKLGNVVTAATAPFFGAIRDDRPALRYYFRRVTEILALMLSPLLLGFLCVADLAVPLVLGSQWSPAVPALRLLVCHAAVQGVITPISQLLVVTGQTRTAMRAGLTALVVLPAAFYLGGRAGGIEGVALGWLLAYLPIMSYPIRSVLRAVDLPAREYLAAVRPAVEGVLTMILTVLAVRAAPWSESGGWVELGVAVGAGALAYLGTVRVRRPDLLEMVTRILRRPAGGAVPQPSEMVPSR